MYASSTSVWLIRDSLIPLKTPSAKMSAPSPGTSGTGASGRGNTPAVVFTAWPRLAMMGTSELVTGRLRWGSAEAESAQAVSKRALRPVTASSADTNVETGRYMAKNCGMQQEVTEAGSSPAVGSGYVPGGVVNGVVEVVAQAVVTDSLGDEDHVHVVRAGRVRDLDLPAP
eukprot:790430-Rhodomonas_salina.3